MLRQERLNLDRWKSNVLLCRWILPVISGILLATAFPPFNLGHNAWFGLIPLLFAVEGCRRGEAFRRGFIAGLVFFGGTVWWTIHVTMAGTVGLIAVLVLYYGAGATWFAWILGLRATKDAFWRNTVAMVLGAAGWVTLEYIRGKFPLGGFGWNGLGVSQYQMVPAIQFAGYTGVYGVSALVCLINFALFYTITRFIRQIGSGEPMRRPSWEFYIAMGLLCAAMMTGYRQIARLRQETPVARQLQLSLVQGNIPQTLKFDPSEKPMILNRYRGLTERVIGAKPELIIWPETATPEALRYDVDSYALASNLACRSHAYLLTGTIDATPFSNPVEAFNAAVLLHPNGRLDERIYRKMHLVPFGEYVPLRKVFPFIKWFTPIQDSFERGKEPIVFTAQDCRFGTVICFEDTVPDLYRQFVQREVNFMVNLTNDAWFKDSPAAQMHLANAVFRAVENRRPLVRATNNGMTCIVDEFGFVCTSLPPFRDAVLTFELSLRNGLPTTFYTNHGDVFVFACLLVSVIGLVLVRRERTTTEE